MLCHPVKHTLPHIWSVHCICCRAMDQMLWRQQQTLWTAAAERVCKKQCRRQDISSQLLTEMLPWAPHVLLQVRDRINHGQRTCNTTLSLHQDMSLGRITLGHCMHVPCHNQNLSCKVMQDATATGASTRTWAMHPCGPCLIHAAVP